MNQSVTKHGHKRKSTTNFSCHKTNMFFIALSLNYTTKETKAHAVNIQNNRVNMQRTSAASTQRQQAHNGSIHTAASHTAAAGADQARLRPETANAVLPAVAMGNLAAAAMGNLGAAAAGTKP